MTLAENRTGWSHHRGRRHRGRAAVEGYIRLVLVHTSERVSVELIDMLVGEEHVALMVHEKLGDTDNPLDVFRVNVYRVRNGKIVEIRIFGGDQYAMD
jgi:ketosteroid isomerase-like protein